MLKSHDTDPYDKTMILQYLKENKVQDVVAVYKYDEIFQVNIADMTVITEDSLFISVNAGLSDRLEQTDPSLYQMALQLWEHFFMSLFPLPLVVETADVWVIAVDVCVQQMNGMTVDIPHILEAEHVSDDALSQAIQQILDIEARS